MTFPELWQDLNFHLPSLYVQNFLVPHPIWSFPTSALARHSSSDQGTMEDGHLQVDQAGTGMATLKPRAAVLQSNAGPGGAQAVQ